MNKAENTPTDASTTFVIGIDIGGSNLRLALADFSGTIVGRWVGSTVGTRDPREIVRLTRLGADALLLEHGASRNQLRAIAAGAPGITDADRGVVVAASYLMGWKDVPFRQLLEAEFGVPAYIDNDVNMAAFGEYASGTAQNTDNFVFLAIGTGIGAGIVLNGQVVRGEQWIAGEIGYMLVPGVSISPIEDDGPGALEEMVGGLGIQTHWKEQWSREATVLPNDAKATQIFDAALAGDSLAQTVLARVSRVLAYAIYNVSILLDCSTIVLGGSVGLHPALAESTGAILQGLNTRIQPQLVASTLGAEAQIIGAIHRALEVSRDRSIAR